MLNAETLRSEAIRRNLEAAEHVIAATIRGYRQLTEPEWNRFENMLIRLLLDVATLDPRDLPVPDGTSDVPLTVLGRALSNCARPNSSYLTGYLNTLASLVCAVAGNFPTAGVFARYRLTEDQELGPFEKWSMLVLSNPRMATLSETALEQLETYPAIEGRALSTGNDEHFNQADDVFAEVAKHCVNMFPTSDALLLLLWSHVRARFRELSAARVLRSKDVDHRYINELLKSSLLLFPTQVQAIEQKSLLRQNGNALVLLPTSTGKSLLGEIALVNSLTEAKPLGVYLAPYRALADQIFQRMRLRLPHVDIACEVRRGGFLSELSVSGERRTVMVATPESFDAFLRVHPSLGERISCAVFDEFHLVEQQGRGLTYEGLVSRLRSCRARIVALSPNLTVSPELVRWLGLDPDNDVISSAWRPTARRLAVARPDKTVQYFTPEDRITGDSIDPVWGGRIPFPHKLEAPVRFQELQTHGIRITDNVAAVAADQYYRLGERPVLVLSGTREQTRTLAARICDHLSEITDSSPVSTLAQEIARRAPYLFSLQQCLAHGVAYHNASLPNWVREALEVLMSKQVLRVVVATTTLAEGVDLPFRTVVMADWQHFHFAQRKPMSNILFRNISGRCGRAGAFAEGDTIIVDNPGKVMGGPHFRVRYQDYMQLYIRPQTQTLCPSVESALTSHQLLRAVSPEDSTPLGEIDAALESQFSAFIGLSEPLEGEEEKAFSDSLFSGQFPSASLHIETVARSLVADALSDPEFAVMARSSPLRLTEFGKAVLVTGLSPRTGMAIGHFLRSYVSPNEPQKGKKERQNYRIQWEPFIAALVNQCQSTSAGFIAELRLGMYLNVGRRGFPVNTTNFLNVVLAWFSGVSVEEIAALTLRDKETRVAADSWLKVLEGALPIKYEETIEQVSAFLTGYISQQWSWVLRGISHISENVPHAEGLDLEALALRAEFGVRYLLSAHLLAMGCPVDRAKLDRLVASFYGTSPSEGTEMALLSWLDELAGTTQDSEVGDIISQQGVHSEGNTLRKFLRGHPINDPA